MFELPFLYHFAESVVVARGLSSDDALLNYDLEELQSPEGRYDLFRKIYGGEQAGGLPYRQLYRRPPPVQEPIPMMPLALPGQPQGQLLGHFLDLPGA